MASNLLPANNQAELLGGQTAANRGLGVKEIAVAALTPLSSLKLTVFLLVAAVVVTWIATLDQTRFDIWQVKNKHFQNVWVEVPFQTFLVPGWFPNHQNVKGSFYVPSGVTILVAMLINLTAAHVLRFRLQAKGLKLVAGILAAIGASALTWAVIFNGQNPDGFQAEPPISWQLMWRLLQIGVLGTGVAAAYVAATVGAERKTERVVMGMIAVSFLSVLGVTFFLGEEAFVGDSAMRILWQLIQASVAGTAALAACSLLFKRKAGIVVVHLGLAGLMLNEIYVTATNEEQRMMIREGQTVSTAIDIREVEFVAINQADPDNDEIIAVPGRQLLSGRWIEHTDLPFQIKCDSFLKNARIIRHQGTIKNDATAGLGKEWLASSVSAGIGTDAEQTADSAAAYVSLRGNDGKEKLGTFMVAQVAYDSGLVDTVEVEGEAWQIGLRFKTAYKPYSMTLDDVQAEYYLSTQIPRWFASEVTLNDSRTGTKSEQRIWMNNPLRYADETFYQSNYERDQSGEEITVLQVVRNKGWMIPYVCCMFTVIGLVAQFGSSLTNHLEKQRKKSAKLTAATSDATATAGVSATEPPNAIGQQSGPNGSRKLPWLAIALTLVFGLYAAGQFLKASRPLASSEGFRLDQLGAIPVSSSGRVQPLDSVARNMARQLGNRETVVDGEGKKQPAIQWLADTVFQKDGFENYRLFRIEDPTIRSALGLKEDHDRFLYSLDDLDGAQAKILELVKESRERWPNLGEDLDKWPMFHQRLWRTYGMLNKIVALRTSLGDPAQRVGDEALGRLGLGTRVIEASSLPLAVPTDDDERAWISLAEAHTRQWVRKVAKERGADSIQALAADLAETEVMAPMREDMLRQQMVQRMLADEGVLKMLKKSTGEEDPQALARLLISNWDAFPKETYREMEKGIAPLVDSMLEGRKARVLANMETQLSSIAGPNGLEGEAISEYQSLLTLEGDYVDGNVESFNASLDGYLTAVRATAPEGTRPRGIRWESVYNAASPFYLAMAIYFAAFVIAALGWVGWMRPVQQAATWLLLLGLVLHVTGLVMRVVVSGRPPVTNLYSSVLFVSAGYVLMMLIVERITKIGVGNAMAAMGGGVALLWAWSMSIVDGDTFAVLVAVLDTQFWLSTHVIIISLGYSATLAAGFLGVAYIAMVILKRLFGSRGISKDDSRLWGNVIYGIVCFGLLLSFFGTVLGGLWGDDSWGRFWGWDPKENGALMIVLWNAVLLHARWGGMIQTRGLAALAVIGNIVTLWSWKGVNSMGVGLHAYAATEDTSLKWILLAAALHLVVLALAMVPIRWSGDQLTKA